MQNFWIIVSIILFYKSFSNAQQRCAKEPDGSHLPIPNSRTTYIHCHGGSDLIRNCPSGQEFNPFDLRCINSIDTNVRSSPNARPSPGSTTLRDRCFNQADGTHLSDPTSRNRFILCTNGDGVIVNCRANEVFNEQTSSCETSRQPPRPPNSVPSRTTLRSPPARPMGTTARTTTRPTRPPLVQQYATGTRFNQPPLRTMFSSNLNQRPIVAF